MFVSTRYVSGLQFALCLSRLQSFSTIAQSARVFVSTTRYFSESLFGPCLSRPVQMPTRSTIALQAPRVARMMGAQSEGEKEDPQEGAVQRYRGVDRLSPPKSERVSVDRHFGINLHIPRATKK